MPTAAVLALYWTWTIKKLVASNGTIKELFGCELERSAKFQIDLQRSRDMQSAWIYSL